MNMFNNMSLRYIFTEIKSKITDGIYDKYVMLLSTLRLHGCFDSWIVYFFFNIMDYKKEKLTTRQHEKREINIIYYVIYIMGEYIYNIYIMGEQKKDFD